MSTPTPWYGFQYQYYWFALLFLNSRNEKQIPGRSPPFIYHTNTEFKQLDTEKSERRGKIKRKRQKIGQGWKRK